MASNEPSKRKKISNKNNFLGGKTETARQDSILNLHTEIQNRRFENIILFTKKKKKKAILSKPPEHDTK